MISVKANFKEVSKQLSDLEKKQIPFATALTLTRLARGSEAPLRQEIDNQLTIRNRTLLIKGVISTKARKSDFPNQKSSVGISERFEFLSQHATGDTRYPITRIGDANYRAIPNEKVIKRTSKGKISKKKRPQFLLKDRSRKKNAFIIKAKSGKNLIVRRKTKRKYPLIVLYKLTPIANIRPSVKAAGTVRRFVHSHANSYLRLALDQSIKTSKK